MDLTNSPTSWAFGSIVRPPRVIRWPSRNRSASSSLISVWESSSFGRSRIARLLADRLHPTRGARPAELLYSDGGRRRRRTPMSWTGEIVIDLDSHIVERVDRFYGDYVDPAYRDAYTQLCEGIAAQAN